MFNMIRTLIRGRVADSADVVESSNALPILRQQLREAAEGVASGRRAVAVVMAYAERERKNAGQLRNQIGDIEARAIDALTKGREDLATEAASTIANLEAELAATEKTILAYDSEIAGMRRVQQWRSGSFVIVKQGRDTILDRGSHAVESRQRAIAMTEES